MTAPTIFYLNTEPGDRIQGMTLVGIRRYAVARGWDVEAVPKRGFGPERLTDVARALRHEADAALLRTTPKTQREFDAQKQEQVETVQEA